MKSIKITLVNFSLIFGILFSGCSIKQSTEISMELTVSPLEEEEIVYLHEIKNYDFIAGYSPEASDMVLIDSAIVTSNKVVFSPDIEEETRLYRIAFVNGFDPDKIIYLNLKKGDHVKVTCNPNDTRSYTIDGNLGSQQIQNMVGKVNTMLGEVVPLWSKSRTLKDLELTESEFLKREKEINEEIIQLKEKQYPNYLKLMNAGFKENEFSGLIAMNMLYHLPVRQSKVNTLNEIVPSLSNVAVKDYLQIKIKRLKEELAQIQRSNAMKGQLISDLELIATDGSKFRLTESLSKLTLIDFWASWCGPCIKHNNNVVLPLYKKYHTLGFEVMGISLDKNKNKWVKSINDNGFIWIHGVKKDESVNLESLYNFNSIPYTLLVNEEGKVIDINIEGYELEAKIKELLVPYQ